MKHYSNSELENIKCKFETIARDNNLIIIYGGTELEGKNPFSNYIRVTTDEDFDWSELLKQVSQSTNPILVVDVRRINEGSFEILPNMSEIDKDLLGENYNEAKKDIKKYEKILKETKVDDIISITVSCNLGNYYIEQEYPSVLSNVVDFEIEDYYQDIDDEEEDFTPPTRPEITELQAELEQKLNNDPKVLYCKNKDSRRGYLRSIIDQMDIDDGTGRYLLHDSIHIIDMAFEAAKDKTK